MDEFVTLGVGIVSGSVAMLAVWGIVSFARRKSLHRRNEKRERIVVSVEEKWTDVDSIIAAYRTGRMTADDFRSSLSEKVEIINRIYKPCLHQLDIFFVKYTEKLIEEYNRMIESAAGSVIKPGGAVTELISSPSEMPSILEGARADDEEATVVSQEESITKDAMRGQTVTESTIKQLPDDNVPQIPTNVEEEVISAMEKASAEEGEMPLETFIEMETASGIEEVKEMKPVLEGKKEKAETVAAAEIPKVKEATEVLEKEHAEGKEHKISPPSAVPDYSEETMLTEPKQQFSFTERVASDIAGSSSAGIGTTEDNTPSDEEHSEDEATMVEAAVEPLPVKIPPVPLIEPPLPTRLRTVKPPPFVVPRQPAPVLSGQTEEAAHPATIYDIEAETIIADRNELLGVSKIPEPQVDKSQLGITGDDVSDMLDQFFGGTKH
ncbi:MAG: hypothetical protein ABSF80_12630 [Chitinispirillaceae bacterium]|jgi:hypothetical protein